MIKEELPGPLPVIHSFHLTFVDRSLTSTSRVAHSPSPPLRVQIFLIHLPIQCSHTLISRVAHSPSPPLLNPSCSPLIDVHFVHQSQPHIDLTRGTLTITAPGMDTSLVVPLAEAQQQQHSKQHSEPYSEQQQQNAGQQGVQNRVAHNTSQQSSDQRRQEVIQVCGDKVCGSVVGVQVVARCVGKSSSVSGSCQNGSTNGNSRCENGSGFSRGVDSNAIRNANGSGGRENGSAHSTGVSYICVHPQAADSADGEEELVRQWFASAVGVPCRLVQQSCGAREARSGTGGVGDRKGREGQHLEQQETEKQKQFVGQQSEQHLEQNQQRLDQQSGQQYLEQNQQHSEQQSVQSEHNQQLEQSEPQQSEQQQQTQEGQRAHLGFANDGQFLLINEASVQDVNARIAAAGSADGSPVELLRCVSVLRVCSVLLISEASVQDVNARIAAADSTGSGTAVELLRCMCTCVLFCACV